MLYLFIVLFHCSQCRAHFNRKILNISRCRNFKLLNYYYNIVQIWELGTLHLISCEIDCTACIIKKKSDNSQCWLSSLKICSASNHQQLCYENFNYFWREKNCMRWNWLWFDNSEEVLRCRNTKMSIIFYVEHFP